MQMSRGRARLAILTIVVSVGLGLLLAGCDTSQPRTRRSSELWSKGLPLGMASLNNQVALQVDEGGHVYVAWVGLDHELRYVQLDERAAIVVDRALDLEENRPLQPRLALDPEGLLHLTWLDKRDRGLQLFYARFSIEGDVVQGATEISDPGPRAAYSVMALDPAGRTVELFWSDNVPARPGVYHAALDWAGMVAAAPELLVADGLWPAAQMDEQGFVHLAWQVQPEGGRPQFHYAIYDPQGRALGPEAVVSQPIASASLLGAPTAGGGFAGPWMGLDDGLVYLAWVLEVRERGQLASFMFYQPFRRPVLDRQTGATILDYAPLQIEDEVVRVWVGDPQITGDPSLLPGQPSQQVLAGYTQASGPGDLEMLQSAAVHLREGQIVGKEVVSATPGASLKPAVAADGQGHLHLVWVDTAGFHRYRVIYASTAPQVGEVLNPITAGEVLDSAFSIGMGAMSLVAVVPFVLMWALPSFLVLVIYSMATNESSLDDRRSVVVLAVAILLQTVMQVWTMAGATEGWLGSMMPAALREVGWLLPLLILGLAVGAMLLYLRRTDNRTLFASFLVYAGVNILLFTLVYLVPIVLGMLGV
jgi:hypothetical protein